MAQFAAVDGDAGGTWSPTSELYILGKGLGFNLPIKSDPTAPWPMFGADAASKRTFKKKFLPKPWRLLAGLQTGGGIIQGHNGGGGEASVELDLPDGATITNVRMYVKIVAGHASLPTFGPGLSVFRGQPGVSAGFVGSPVMLNVADVGDGKEIVYALPGSFGAYNALGEVFVDYACTQNNVTDRGNYCFYATIQDETGAGAINGNLYSGFEVTFTLPKLAVDGALQ